VRRALFVFLGLFTDCNTLLRGFGANGLRFVIVGAAVLAAPLVLAAQTPGAQRIVSARAMLKMAKLDSAIVLLRLVIDSQAPSSTGERVDAWVLLGIAAYYRGNESAVTDAFRRALALAPQAQVTLPDPALQRIFDGLRPPSVVAGMPALPSPGGVDTQPHPDIPGAYAAGECHPAPFPVQLPPLDSVLDSAALAPALKSAGVDKPIVLALRLGTIASAPRVRVVERKVSGQVADRALQKVDAAVRVIPTDRDWAFRLRVDVEPDVALTLERSQVCAAVPGPRPGLVYRVGQATPEEWAQMRLQAEEATAHLRSLLHRVLVDAKGQVVTVKRVHSSGDARLDQSEEDALQRRPFTPTKLDGVAVTAWVEVRGVR
jgi:hypothetical protein